MNAHVVECGEVSLYAEVHGEGSQTVLLIAGLGAQLTDWHDDFVAQLVERGNRVVRFDNRDSGLSTHLDGTAVPNALDVWQGLADPPYSLEDMADDTARLIHALDVGPVLVIGQSLGSMVAQCLAIRHASDVTGMVLLSTTTGRPGVGQPEPEELARLVASQQEPTSGQPSDPVQQGVRSSSRRASWELGMTEEELEARIRARVERRFDRAGNQRQYAAVVGSADRTQRLARVRVPVAVLHGRDDPLIQCDGGEAVASALPDATLQIIDKWRHDLPRSLWPVFLDAVEDVRSRA